MNQIPDAKPVRFPGFEDYHFYIHRAEQGWLVSEGTTRRQIGLPLPTRKEALAQAERMLNTAGRVLLQKAIDSWLP